jgi:hypothetical protein
MERDCFCQLIPGIEHRMNDRGSVLGKEKTFFFLPLRPGRFWRSPRALSTGYLGIYPGVKRLRRESDHSPPSSVEVKNGGAIPPLPIYPNGTVLNYMDNFIFTLESVEHLLQLHSLPL